MPVEAHSRMSSTYTPHVRRPAAPLFKSVLDCCDLSHAGDFALKRPINASSALRLLPPDRREA